MDTIMNYLNTMFATVAQTEQMQKIKNDLAANMEDKYNELKAEGKSENEAVGTVISEFGNIDELLKDIGLQPLRAENGAVEPAGAGGQTAGQRRVTKEEVENYLAAKKKHNKMTAEGVVLIMLGVICMILLFGIFEMPEYNFSTWPESIRGAGPVILLLLTVMGAVSLFIISGNQFEKYAYMENGVSIPEEIRQELRNQMEQDRTINTMAVTIGVGLCIFGVIVLLTLGVMSEKHEIMGSIGVASLLSLVAVACYLFICPGGMKEAYEKLLGVGDFAPERARENKIVGVVASIVWPLTVAAFLVWGLAFDGWKICWILFPVVGICFGGFAAACGAMHEKR
ncbi:MAG: permease prefix domain 1-containing protein [bacterium]|nr:permease prefix domain 1-containing protein [bacterium]